MTTLSYTATVRLAIWRELHARGGFIVIFVGLIAVGASLPSIGREAWEIFVLSLILPPLAIALALRVPAQADSFWRGLGGHGTARALGTAFVHLGVLLSTAFLVDLGGPFNRDGVHLLDDDELRVLYPVSLCSLWALVFAGRAVAQGLVAVLPLLVAGTGVFLVTYLGDEVYHWPAVSAVSLRILLIGATGMLCGVFLEGRVGPWGGAIARRGAAVLIVPAVLVLVLLGSIAVEAVTPPHWRIVGAEWGSVAADGSAALRHSLSHDEPWTPWLQMWTPEEGLSWWHRGDGDLLASVGPAGAVLIGDHITWPDGSSTTCEGGWDVMNWGSDGRAVAVLLPREDRAADGEVWGFGGRWILVRENGCSRLPRSVRWVVARDNGEILFVEDEQLHMGTSCDTSHPVLFPDGKQGDWISVRSGPNITLVRRRLGSEHSLWMLRGESLVVLARNSTEHTPDPRFHFRMQRVGGSYQTADGCASHEDHLSCWNDAGERVVGPLSQAEQRGLFFLGHGWVWNQTRGLLVRPSDGAEVLLPDAQPVEEGEYENREAVVLLPGGGARHFARGGRVHDIELPD